jgi:2-amino-4-hydroxy-6-hydroxymethyldihydropteridine diphosphokinase
VQGQYNHGRVLRQPERWGNTIKTLVIIAIGANLPGPAGRSPLETARHAVACLNSLPDLRLSGLSRWFLSAPVPPSHQPDYVNGVASLVVEPGKTIDPALLLSRLMAVETSHGRQRGEVNAARTLDLDIISIGALVRAAPDPILPHPRAHERAFVLAPLADVAPGWVHPVLGLTATALLAGLPSQAIRTL